MLVQEVEGICSGSLWAGYIGMRESLGKKTGLQTGKGIGSGGIWGPNQIKDDCLLTAGKFLMV